MSNIIDHLADFKIIPIVVLNKIFALESAPSRTIDEIEHVLVMHNASDEQLNFLIVYFDDEKRSAALSARRRNKRV